LAKITADTDLSKVSNEDLEGELRAFFRRMQSYVRVDLMLKIMSEVRKEDDGDPDYLKLPTWLIERIEEAASDNGETVDEFLEAALSEYERAKRLLEAKPDEMGRA
jgi:hypothetical protein